MRILRIIVDFLDALDEAFFACPWCGRRLCTTDHWREAQPPALTPINWHARGPFFQPTIDREGEARRDQIAQRLSQPTVRSGDLLKPWRDYIEEAFDR